MTTTTNIVADAAALHALLQVVVSEQIHLADIEAQNRVTWLLHLAVTLADKVATAVDELVTQVEAEGA
jgi:hypothetical protein